MMLPAVNWSVLLYCDLTKQGELKMNYYNKEVELSVLVGKTIKEIKGLEKESDEVRVITDDDNEYLFYHQRDCCEHVALNDFEISSESLVGGLITLSEQLKNVEDPIIELSESYTWTFYKIETDKGGLWMRWLGESNGYYSEEVDFVWVNKPET